MGMRDVLVSALIERFADQHLHLGAPPGPIATFPARHSDVGDVSVAETGIEANFIAIVAVGGVIAEHFHSHDDHLEADERLRRLTMSSDFSSTCLPTGSCSGAPRMVATPAGVSAASSAPASRWFSITELIGPMSGPGRSDSGRRLLQSSRGAESQTRGSTSYSAISSMGGNQALWIRGNVTLHVGWLRSTSGSVPIRVDCRRLIGGRAAGRRELGVEPELHAATIG